MARKYKRDKRRKQRVAMSQPPSSMAVYRSYRPQAIGYGARLATGHGFMSSFGRSLKQEGLRVAGDTLAGLSKGDSFKDAAVSAIKGAAKRKIAHVTDAIKTHFKKKKSVNTAARPSNTSTSHTAIKRNKSVKGVANKKKKKKAVKHRSTGFRRLKL